MSIPKKMYYVWIGNKEKPEIFYKCYKSWKEKMPDYEIIEINEENFDINYHYKNNRFFRECWNRKLWAYVSDYIRVYHLYKYGGIYLDIDMELIKSISPIIKEMEKKNLNFITAFESDEGVGISIYIAKEKSKVLKKILEFYEKDIWKTPLFTSPHIIKEIFEAKYGYNLNKKEIKDIENGIYILKKEYFYPFLPNENWNKNMIIEENYGIHWWHHSWKGKKPFLFLKTKHLKGWKKLLKKIGIYLQIFRDFIRKK